jgi:hypothetical protein
MASRHWNFPLQKMATYHQTNYLQVGFNQRAMHAHMLLINACHAELLSHLPTAQIVFALTTK